MMPNVLPRGWTIVAMLSVVAMLNYLDRVVIATMRSTLMEFMPMSDEKFGLLTAVFLLTYGLLSPVGGFLADRFSRSRLIIISLLAWSFLTWLTGHVKTYEQMLWVRALMGISEAAYLPAALALIADYHRGPTRSLATGLHMIGISFGNILAGYGGWFGERIGWTGVFDIFGLFGIGYAIGLCFILRDAPSQVAPAGSAPGLQSVKPVEALVSLFQRRSFLLLLGYWTFFGLAGWAVTTWMPTYFKEQFGLSQGKAGIVATSYMYAAGICGKFIGGTWADQWSRTHPRGRIFVPAIGMMVAAPAIVMVAGASLLPVAIAGLAVFGMMRAFSDANLMPILCQVSDARYRATGYGLLNMFSCLAGGIGAWAGGFLRDAHINVSALFYGSAVALLACGALMFMVKPTENEAASR